MPSFAPALHRRRAAALLVALLVAGCGGRPTGTAPASGPTFSPSPGASAPGSLGPSPSGAEPVPGLASTTTALDGHGPLGIDVRDGVAWIAAFDSSSLVAVELATPDRQRSFDLGGGGSHVLVTPTGEVLVAAIDRTAHGTLIFLDPATGTVGGLDVGPLAGFGLGDDGRVWTLGTLGQVVVVGADRTGPTGRTSIDVPGLEHLDAVFASGAFWAASDSTPVRRLEGTTPAVTATIETGGGIPLAVADGLVWGARADELWAIDPATDEVTRRVSLAGLIEILDLDIADGQAWIAARKPGRVGVVVGIDLATGRPIGEVPVRLPAGVVIAPGDVWVTDYETDGLVEITLRPGQG